MDIDIKPGKYVIAVSGGVDSVVLLDVLSKNKDLELIVAHLDHGIRPKSADDANFVKNLSKKYNYEFITKREELGRDASEATAREARYRFLYQTMRVTKAKAIITAHHHDDQLETALINLVRGTGRKGLSSLGTSNEIVRPLLQYSKQQIIEYARSHNLFWVEDESNMDDKYLRNRIRKLLAKDTNIDHKKRLAKLIKDVKKTNEEIDDLLKTFASKDLDRRQFVLLDHKIAIELLAFWLRSNEISFDSKTLELLCVRIKTGRSGSLFPIKNDQKIKIGKDFVQVDGV